MPLPMDKMLVRLQAPPPPPLYILLSFNDSLPVLWGSEKHCQSEVFFSRQQDNKTTTQPSLKTQTACLKVQHPKNAVLVITRSKVNIKVMTDAYVLRGKCEYTNNFHVGLTDWRLFNWSM